MSETSEKNNQWTFEYVVRLWQEGGFESIAELHNKTLKGGDASCLPTNTVSQVSNPQPKGSSPKAAAVSDGHKILNAAIEKDRRNRSDKTLNEIAEKAANDCLNWVESSGKDEQFTQGEREKCVEIVTLALQEAHLTGYRKGVNDRDAQLRQQLEDSFNGLKQAREFLRKYQQRYHGAEHAQKLWNEVDAFLNPKTDQFP